MARQTARSDERVIVDDRVQRGYRYVLSEQVGRNFDPEFTPELTPKEMLEVGVFGGKYMTDCRDEFPARWFTRAKLSPKRSDPALNYFGVDASQPLSEWRRKGWIHDDDPRDGSSGIAATTWVGACPRRISARSSAGKPSAATSRRSGATANRAIRSVGHGRSRPCCTGPTTAESCKPAGRKLL